MTLEPKTPKSLRATSGTRGPLKAGSCHAPALLASVCRPFGTSQTLNPNHRANTFTPNFVFPLQRGQSSTSLFHLREASLPLSQGRDVYPFGDVDRRVCACTEKALPFCQGKQKPPLLETFPPSSHIRALNIPTKHLHTWGNFCQQGLLLLPFLAPGRENKSSG